MGWQFPGSLQELVHNKPAMIGLAGAGGLGLVVWYRHRKAAGPASGAGAAAGAGQVSQGYSGGLGGTLDTTGTDLAAYLGDFSAGLSNQLNGWLQQAQQTLTIPPATSPSPPPPQGGGANNNKGPIYTTVQKGWSVDQWIKDLQKGYGPGVRDVTWDSIFAANGGSGSAFDKDILWKGGYGAGNTFKQTMVVRVK